MAVKPIPDGFHTVTPFLNVKGAAELIKFLENALGAEEVMRMLGPGGMVMHAEVDIGNSRLMLAEATQSAPSSSSFYLYVKDVDALYKRAIGAGAISEASQRTSSGATAWRRLRTCLETHGPSPRTRRMSLPRKWQSEWPHWSVSLIEEGGAAVSDVRTPGIYAAPIFVRSDWHRETLLHRRIVLGKTAQQAAILERKA